MLSVRLIIFTYCCFPFSCCASFILTHRLLLPVDKLWHAQATRCFSWRLFCQCGARAQADSWAISISQGGYLPAGQTFLGSPLPLLSAHPAPATQPSFCPSSSLLQALLPQPGTLVPQQCSLSPAFYSVLQSHIFREGSTDGESQQPFPPRPTEYVLWHWRRLLYCPFLDTSSRAHIPADVSSSLQGREEHSRRESPDIPTCSRK